MNRGVLLGFVALLATPTAALAQASLERGRYLVDTVMTCHNCHTPMGPNGPQFDKALLRFDEPAFDVIASNITPDRNTGIGDWSDAEIKAASQEGKRRRATTLLPSCRAVSTRFSPRGISTALSLTCAQCGRWRTRC